MVFAQILKDCGIEAIEDPETTVTAFDYEINGTIFDPDSPFDIERSDLQRLPEVLESMVVCKLRLLPGKTRWEGLQYLMKTWYRWLAYDKSKHESIHRSESVFGTEVKIFTVGQGSACSLIFTIVDQAAEDAKADFIGGYSAVDNPKSLKI